MAYNNPYMPYGYPQYTPQPQIQPQPEPPKQIQYSVVNAPSIDYAKNYPVAPGNCVSFKIDNQPFLCTKSMSFSPLDKPVFDVYRLVKEEDTEIQVQENKPEYALKEDITVIENRLSEIEKALKPVPKKKPVKTEESENE